MKTIGFIHTALILVDIIKKELSVMSLKVDAFHLVDESLLIDLMKVGRLNPQIIRKLCHHVVSAEETGADIIAVTCSSISPTVDVAKRLVDRPVLKIDEPMAEAAVIKGEKIGVIATVATTLDPATNLLREKAAEKGRKIQISAVLCQEAFKTLLQGDREKHDQIVIEKALELSKVVDVLVLAQGSMAPIALSLRKLINIPVLSSPRLFAEMLKSML